MENWEDSEEAKHSAVLFHYSNQDVRMTLRVCQTNSLLKSEYTAKGMGTLGFQDSDAKRLLLLNRVFRVGTDQSGQFLKIEPDLRHSPFIRKESGCTVEKLQDKLVSVGRNCPILKEEDATRCRSACLRLFFDTRQIRLCRNRKTFCPEDE